MSSVVDPSITLPVDAPPGTVAHPLLRRRGDREIRDRRGRRRITRALVTATNPSGDLDVDEADLRWIYARPSRRLASIRARFPDLDVPVRLCQAGVVDLVYDVTEELQLGQLREWRLTHQSAGHAQDHRVHRSTSKSRQRHLALTVADEIEPTSPQLASALRSIPPSDPTGPLAALTAAARDLIEGRLHGGPRAFSQHHFGDSKVRDDIPRLLNRHGVSADIADRLGVRRARRLGLAGPITLHTGNAEPIHLDGWDGPIAFRVDQPGLQVTAAHRPIPAMVVVENLQAAEWAADQHPEALVVYTPGQLSEPAAHLISSCAQLASQTLAICDADLGGVRISAQIATAASNATIIDIAHWPHTKGPAIEPGSITATGLQAALDGPAATLAAAILKRGYRVEQEQPTTAALRDLLARR
jgi:hypothetical protein